MAKIVDITGQRFGRLLVVRRGANDGRNHPRWECLCDCGQTRLVAGGDLKRGHHRSCGCWRNALISDARIDDLTGQRFGRLQVLERADRAARHPKWRCVCECGQRAVVAARSLKSGDTRSCGCLQRELLAERSTQHGMATTPIYRLWKGMRQRCEDANHAAYSSYGGRGIKVCERWQFFENFLADMGERTGPEWTIERVDVNGDYEPDNCWWATREAQAQNKRPTKPRPLPTHCPRGHLLSPDNVDMHRDGTRIRRSCKTCRRERLRGMMRRLRTNPEGREQLNARAREIDLARRRERAAATGGL